MPPVPLRHFTDFSLMWLHCDARHSKGIPFGNERKELRAEYLAQDVALNDRPLHSCIILCPPTPITWGSLSSWDLVAQQVWKDLGRRCSLEFYCWEKTGNLAGQKAKVRRQWKVSLWTKTEGYGGIEAEQQLGCLTESQQPSSGTQKQPFPLLQQSSRKQMWRNTQ